MGNPFISAYVQSDGFGKAIFIGLFLLSVLSWTVLLYKLWVLIKVKKSSKEFASFVNEEDILALQLPKPIHRRGVPHPFFDLYKAVKNITLRLLNRPRELDKGLDEFDFERIEMQASSTIASCMKTLEKNLFLLSMVVTLAPFLGLLGTVWGILVSFSHLQMKGMAAANSTLLSGLSLALTTTVIGLLEAIPAVVAYNYLKIMCREYKRDLEEFALLMLTSLDLTYRKIEHGEKVSTEL